MIRERQISDPRIADLVQAGKVRVALYVPNYVKDPETGELHGWAPDVVRALGAHFGIVGVPLEHPHPPAAMASLKSGADDAAILGIVASRAAEVDYTAPLVEADYTILAPAGSPYRSLADADRAGVRIAAVRNHASTMALAQIVRHATFLYADMPDPTFEILRSGNADLFASLRQVLLQYSAQLPGARLFDGRYGFNSIGIAVPQGMPGRLAAMNEFAKDAKSSGLVRQAVDHSGWSGIQVAPRNNPAVIR